MPARGGWSAWQAGKMDIGFTEEQELLRDTARKFLDGNCTTRFVRDMMVTEAAVTPEFWRQLADNGWLGIAFPESNGGSGLGLTELVVLMEEIGRAVMPGPYPATVLLGGATIAEAGSAGQRGEWLPRIAAGEAKATLAWTEPNARWMPPGSPRARARQAAGSRCRVRRCLSRTRIWPMSSSSRLAHATAARWRTASACFWCRRTRPAWT